jgi:fructuronate reductase
MKLRLLNGAHTAIAAIGQVAGFVDRIRNHRGAGGAQLPPALLEAGGAHPGRHGRPGQILGAADETVRQSRPEPSHRPDCQRRVQKVPQRVLASLAELITDKKEHDALVYAVAAWIRSCADKNESGASLLRNDPAFHAWNGRPADDADAAATVTAFLDFSVVFGRNRKSDPALVRELTTALQNIRQYGILAALDRAFGQPKE